MDSHEAGAPSALVAALWRHAHDIVVEAERDGRVVDANDAAQAWFGREDLRLLEVVHPDHAPRLLAALAGETPATGDFFFSSPGGAGWQVLEISAAVPQETSTLLVGRDVTVERRTAATLTHHRQALTLVAQQEPLGAALDALARSIELVSDGARVAVLVAHGADLELVAAPSLRADASRALARVAGAASAETFPGAGALSGRLAEIASELGLGFGWAAPLAEGDRREGVLVLFPGAKRFPSADEQAALEAAVPLASVAIGAAATHERTRRAERGDALTGVLARPVFVTELAQLGRRARDVLGLLVVTVEDLALVNTLHGLAAGDAILQAVASRLGAMVRGRDVVGRISGHRFAVACVGLRDLSSLEQFAGRMRTVLGEPVVTGAGVLPVAVNVTATVRTAATAEATALLVEAERIATDAPGAAADTDADDAEPDSTTADTVAAFADATKRRLRGSGAGQIDR